jgi:3-carboxy-cis,cis-muconate cycloisomerase
MTASMYDSFLTGHWFDAEAKHVWRDTATLQSWLDVEAALANAQAALGLIPPGAAARIAEKAHTRFFDTHKLADDIAHAQHPLVPVLHQLEALVGEPDAGFIHWGATTQNIFDTASALQMRATHAILMRHLDAGIASLARLAQAHRDTVMPGRTHGQHALPMTLGFKLAGWVAELDRHRTRLQDRLATSFTASMGGAIGTYAAMGPLGRQVEGRLAEQLGLLPSGLPMRSSYDRVNDYVGVLAMLAATAQKIAQDVVFMQRTEVGEAAEAFHLGKVGSSTMAQKRNPSTALLLASLCRMLRGRAPMALEAMVRMDEGDSSATNVCDTLLPEVAILATSIAGTLDRLAHGLVVHPAQMRRNLELTQGLIASEAAMMSLTKHMGRHQAHRLLYEAAQRSQSEGVPFAQAIREHPLWATEAFPPEVLESLDASAYVGDSATLAAATAARVSGRS